MGEAEDNRAEADDLSSGQEEDRGGAESKVGEDEGQGVIARRRKPRPESRLGVGWGFDWSVQTLQVQPDRVLTL
jgi:hypothetical protein